MVAPLFLLGAALAGGNLLLENQKAKAADKSFNDFLGNSGYGGLGQFIDPSQRGSIAMQILQSQQAQKEREQQQRGMGYDMAKLAWNQNMQASHPDKPVRNPITGRMEGGPNAVNAAMASFQSPGMQNAAATQMIQQQFAKPPQADMQTVFDQTGRNLGARNVNDPTVQAGLSAGKLFLESPVSTNTQTQIMTPQEVEAAGLPASGTYQRDNTGKIQTITSPTDPMTLAKEERAARADTAAYESAKTGFQSLIDTAKEIRDSKALPSITGIMDANTPSVFPASRALEAKVETLKSQLALQAINAARQGSAAGATGFGALSAPELNIIQTAVAKIDLAAGEAVVKKQLDEIIGYAERLMNNLDVSRGLESPTGGWSIKALP